MIAVGIDGATQCGYAALRVELASVRGPSQGLSNRWADGSVQISTRAGTSKRSPELSACLTVERLASGRWDLSPLEGEDQGDRFLRLWKRLGELKREIEFAGDAIDRAALELPGHYKSNHTTLVCFGIAAHVQSWAARNGVPCDLIGITEVKVAATGGGKATGGQTIAAVAKLLGHRPSSDDEAEAILVALVAAARKLDP
jgi:Holliday junction resolvasome RuvABC endonuclease subunit